MQWTIVAKFPIIERTVKWGGGGGGGVNEEVRKHFQRFPYLQQGISLDIV